GVVRPPSAFSRTVGSPPSITATHELVVPRSIPIVFATFQLPPGVSCSYAGPSCPAPKKSKCQYGRFSELFNPNLPNRSPFVTHWLTSGDRLWLSGGASGPTPLLVRPSELSGGCWRGRRGRSPTSRCSSTGPSPPPRRASRPSGRR